MQKFFYYEKLPLSIVTTIDIHTLMELNNSQSNFHVHFFSLQVFLWANAWKGVENTVGVYIEGEKELSLVFLSAMSYLFMFIYKSWRKFSSRATLYQNGVRIKGSSSSIIHQIYVPLEKITTQRNSFK